MSNYNYSFRRNRIEGPTRQVAASDIFTPTVDQKHTLGLEFDLNDATGRVFRYSKNGAVALTPALVTQQAAGTANWQNEVQTTGTAADVGDTSIKVFTTTAPTLNIWNDGYLTIEDGDGETQMYLIKEHDVPSDTLTTIQIVDTGGIRIATAVTSEVTITKNLYRDVVVSITDPTGIATGLPLSDVPISYFYWSQVTGPAPLVIDGTDSVEVGDMIAGSGSVDGAGALPDAAADDVLWGRIMRAPGTSETALVYLTIE